MRRSRRASTSSHRSDSDDDGSAAGLSSPSPGSFGLLLLALAFLSRLAAIPVVEMRKRPAPILPAEDPPSQSAQPPAPPSAIASSASSSQRLLNVAVATDLDEPFGLLALINSTICHCSSPSDLRFHVIVPPGSRRRLRLLLESLFPPASFRMYSLDVGGARSKILRHLRRREREPVLVSPYRYTLAYLPLLLPVHVRRVLWLQTDVLVLADVAPLVLETELRGAPAGAVEDCANPAGHRINNSHPGVSGALTAETCGIDTGVVLIDLVQWGLLDMVAPRGLGIKKRSLLFVLILCTR